MTLGPRERFFSDFDHSKKRAMPTNNQIFNPIQPLEGRARCSSVVLYRGVALLSGALLAGLVKGNDSGGIITSAILIPVGISMLSLGIWSGVANAQVFPKPVYTFDLSTCLQEQKE